MVAIQCQEQNCTNDATRQISVPIPMTNSTQRMMQDPSVPVQLMTVRLCDAHITPTVQAVMVTDPSIPVGPPPYGAKP